MDDLGSWIFKAIIFGFYGYSLVWVYRDAKKVGKDPTMVTVLCALCGWPMTLILWGAFRPAAPAPPEEPINCVRCQTIILGGQTVCPKCGWSYKT
jgi:hypothetical protein